MGVINGQEHFDGRVDPHAHFVCKQCGAVLDVPEEFFQEEDFVRLFAKYRLQVENARVLFEGLCPQCQESERDIAL